MTIVAYSRWPRVRDFRRFGVECPYRLISGMCSQGTKALSMLSTELQSGQSGFDRAQHVSYRGSVLRWGAWCHLMLNLAGRHTGSKKDRSRGTSASESRCYTTIAVGRRMYGFLLRLTIECLYTPCLQAPYVHARLVFGSMLDKVSYHSQFRVEFFKNTTTIFMQYTTLLESNT